MKTKLLSMVAGIAMYAVSYGQNNFTAGWYVVQSNAQYAKITTQPASDTTVYAGTVVLAYDFSGGDYLCYDCDGSIISFKGATSLVKAPVSPASFVGLVKTTTMVDAANGIDLDANTYVWVTQKGNMYSVLIQDGKTFDVSADLIDPVSGKLRQNARKATYLPVSSN